MHGAFSRPRPLPAAAIFLLSTTAMAQTVPDEGDAVEDIVVTAQKREQSLQDVPISITALTRKTIEDYQIEGIQDYAQINPNVGLVNRSISRLSLVSPKWNTSRSIFK